MGKAGSMSMIRGLILAALLVASGPVFAGTDGESGQSDAAEGEHVGSESEADEGEETKGDGDESEPVVEVTPYGFARLDSVLLTHRMNHPQYSMWVRPGDVTSGGRPNLTIYARLTRVGLRLTSDALGEAVDLRGKIEADFQNGGSESRPLPRLRHGYGRLDGGLWTLLAGQTWDLTSPLYPSAHADALMWHAGNLGDRRPQLRVGVTPGDEDRGFRTVVAAATTGAIDGQDLDTNGRLDGFEAGVPMLQWLGGLHWTNWTGRKLVFGVSGHYAVERLAASVPKADGSGERFGGEQSFQSWSVAGHLEFPLTGWLTLRGEAFFGQNLGDVRGGIGQSINAATGGEIRSRGGWAEVDLSPTDAYTLAVGGSLDDPVDEDLNADNNARARTLNRSVYLVQTIRPWKPVRFGLEYWLWQTRYREAPTGTAHRVNLHTSFYF